MKKLIAVGAVVGFAALAEAGTIWTEDFTDVADWAVLNDPGGGAQVSTDGSLGYMKVRAASNQAAFAPSPDLATLAEFDVEQKKNYSLTFTIDRVSSSCSYQLALDEFSSKNGGYLSTVWQVFPPAGSSVTTGTFTVDLGKFNFNTGTHYVLPKILISTGNGDQLVKMDHMRIDFNP
jgi:hypothetical protein